MKREVLLCAVSLSLVLPRAAAQTGVDHSHPAQTVVSLAASAPTAVPPLVPYSGVALSGEGKPLSGSQSITFLVFKESQSGEPLWSETQSVFVDGSGHYEAQLGASSANGIPLDLFSTGEARWLDVQIAGQNPQPRVLLASVPYALKAGDATTLGGLPISAFALAGARSTTTGAAAQEITPDLASNVTTTGGTGGYLPEFSGATTIVDSPVFASSGKVGIGTTTPAQTLDVNGTTVFRGDVFVYHNGTATPTAGVNSVPMVFLTEGYNSSTKSVVAPAFQWKAEVVGNNTASPSATQNLIYSNGTTAAETGLYFNDSGTIHFAPGQTFPGTGSGTITGVTAGTDLTGGGTSGNVTLNLDTTKIITGLTAGAGLTGGGSSGNVTLNVDPAQVPYLGLGNSFLAPNFFAGNVGIGGPPSGNGYTPLSLSGNSNFGTWLVLNNTSTSGNGSGHLWNILSAGSVNAEGAGSLAFTDFTGTSNIFLEGNVIANSAVINNRLQTNGPSFLNGPVSINGDTAMTHNPRMTFSGFLMGNLGSDPTGGFFVPDQNIVITRILGFAGTNGYDCTGLAQIAIFANGGATPIAILSLPNLATTFDSGAGTLNVAVSANTQLVIGSVGATGCSSFPFGQSPQNVFVNVEYAMQ